MSDSGSKQLASYLLSTLQYEVGVTTGVLNAVPGDRLDYRPDPVAKSALELVQHITLEDEWFLNSICEGSFSQPPSPEGCGIDSPADAVARYQERVPAAMERVAGLSS